MKVLPPVFAVWSRFKLSWDKPHTPTTSRPLPHSSLSRAHRCSPSFPLFQFADLRSLIHCRRVHHASLSVSSILRRLRCSAPSAPAPHCAAMLGSSPDSCEPVTSTPPPGRAPPPTAPGARDDEAQLDKVVACVCMSARCRCCLLV